MLRLSARGVCTLTNARSRSSTTTRRRTAEAYNDHLPSLPRARVERVGRRWPYTIHKCEECTKEFYLPAHLGCPADADLEWQPLLLRFRLWELDQCIGFLLETSQVGEQERLRYAVWHDEETARIAEMDSAQSKGDT